MTYNFEMNCKNIFKSQCNTTGHDLFLTFAFFMGLFSEPLNCL